MVSRRISNDLVLFSSQDPQPLVNWLCETFGLTEVLQAVAQYRAPGQGAEAPAKRAYKKRGGKKRGAKKDRKKAGRPRKQVGAGTGQG
jgi:hypothetical protein